MYVHSVKLTNYKSFGDYKDNELIVEPRITAIVGKNGSGKSNVLDGLSCVSFISKNNNAAFNQNNVNRNTMTGTENKYLIVLKPTSDDIETGIIADTTIDITKDRYSATGGFLDFYQLSFYPLMDEVFELLGALNANSLRLKDSEWISYQSYYNELINQSEMDIPKRTAAFEFLIKKADRIVPEKRDELIEKTKQANERWIRLINTLPSFFYRKADKHLNTTYRVDDIEKELTNPESYPNSLLSSFVKMIGVTNDDFLLASRAGINGAQENIRRKINRLIKERINQRFNEFYETEEICLDVSFNNGTIVFVIQSNNGSSLMLSERSNGLRWYLETFIDAQANSIPDRNTVYLLDEPGTSLHVNAQRELLNLFGHLADRGNQIIYTTHSPYMLDTENEGVHRIRAVVKDKEGFSYIYKTVYDPRIAPETQYDTLSPIVSALGMSIQHTFGPAKDKINIVTEGMSDYIFVCTMAKVLGVDTNRYVIIPSVGASNCINICAILQGWNCKFIALFDYDDAGVESGGEYLRKNLCYEYRKQYCYLLDVSEDDIKKRQYKHSSFMIEDLMIRSEIERFCSENKCGNCNKTLTAKLMANAIEAGTFNLSEETINNFRELFERIFLYCI